LKGGYADFYDTVGRRLMSVPFKLSGFGRTSFVLASRRVDPSGGASASAAVATMVPTVSQPVVLKLIFDLERMLKVRLLDRRIKSV
jgi:hypothetical protein